MSEPIKKDAPFYALAAVLGTSAGWVDVRVGDLLFTALIALASCMLMGVIRPHKPWRWITIMGIMVPAMQLLAYFFMTQKPWRAQVYESFLVWLPGAAGAYGGAILRGAVENLLRGN